MRGRLRTVILAGAALVSCTTEPVPAPWFEAAQQAAGAPARDETEKLEAPAPPFSPGIFPCSRCHGREPFSRERREMSAHKEIVLRHDEAHRWCLDCHDATERDMLRLAGGELVPFGESYRLCGQCHGDKYRDWRAGVHGRRSGEWSGHRTYLLCAHCHNPHQPGFHPGFQGEDVPPGRQPIVPSPPPVRPGGA